MDIIFSSSSLRATPSWLETRMMVMGGITAFLVLSYIPVWNSFNQLIRTYRNSPVLEEKPPLSALQASYIYLKKDYLCMSTWLIGLCQSGVLKLYYKKGDKTWSICRNNCKCPATEFDKNLLDELFKHGELKAVKDDYFNPDLEFEEVSKRLLNKTKADTINLLKKKDSSLLAWCIVLFFFIELITVGNIYNNNFGFVAIGFMLSLSTSAFVYGMCFLLPSLFTGNKLTASLVALFLFINFSLFHWGGLSIYNSSAYFYNYFYLDVAVAIATAVHCVPNFPKDFFLLSKIIGHQKFLINKSEFINKNDLIWALGLDVFNDLARVKLAPDKYWNLDWLKSDNEDTNELIRRLCESFSLSVKDAINGANRGRNLSHTSNIERRY